MLRQMTATIAFVSACLLVTPCEAATMRFECEGAPTRATTATDLWGLWDVIWDVSGRPNIGVLALGIIDGGLSGTIALPAGVVMLRSFTVNGQSVQLVVASPQGDVRFTGSLAPNAQRMCGTVTYHDGRTFQMIAEKRVGAQGARDS